MAPSPPPALAEARKDPRNVFGNYVALEEIARTGMSRVYRAWDVPGGRAVALKVLASTPDVLDRFVQEAQLAACLEHPNIAAVYGAGRRDDTTFYIAIQFVDGRPIDGTRRPVGRTLMLVRDVALALQYAHDQDVVHRDVKPANILVSFDSAGGGRSAQDKDREEHAFLTDFGTAKEIHGDFGEESTPGVVVRGTPEFLSPEQARGDAGLDGRSDIYSLGATLYHLLTGRPPLFNTSITQLLYDVQRRPPPPLRELNPRVPQALADVVHRALEKEPGKRYARAADFADALARLTRRR